MTLVKTPSSLLDRVAEEVEAGPPTIALFTTFTFNHEYFERRFLPQLVGEYGEHEREVGALLVCDGRFYRGHSSGSWLKCWPGTELFHPKIALLVFENRTILFAGSGNLTPCGQEQNLEIIGETRWSKKGVPASLVSLLKRVGGPLAKDLLKLKPLPGGALRTSLDSPIGEALNWERADEAWIVSPFFDASESAAPDDLSFVPQLLAGLKQKPKVLHLAVPILGRRLDKAGKAVAKVPLVKGVLGDIRKGLCGPAQGGARGGKLLVWGAHEDRYLHAKVVALRQGDRVLVVAGSANATSAGMSRANGTAAGGNVEASWRLETTAKEFKAWFEAVGPWEELEKFDLLAQLPKPTPAVSSPLQAVELDRVRSVLRLSWREGTKTPRPAIRYGKATLKVKRDEVRDFRIGKDWFVEVAASAEEWLPVPIEASSDLPRAHTQGGEASLSPEDALAQLGGPGFPPPVEEDGGPSRRTKGKRVKGAKGPIVADHSDESDLFARLQQLASNVAAAREALETSARIPTAEAILRAARLHDPAAKDLSHTSPEVLLREQLWRYWVRLEMARLLEAASTTGLTLSPFRRALRPLLSTRSLPKSLRESCNQAREIVL